MATCVITGTIKDLSETAIENVEVQIELQEPIESGTDWIAAKRISTVTDSNGDFTLTCIRSVDARITVLMPTGDDAVTPVVYLVTVPDAATANFEELI